MSKKCVVKINDEELPATFYGVFQKSWTHGESLTVGGFPAGQIAFPIAVVDYGEGLKEVEVNTVEELKEC